MADYHYSSEIMISINDHGLSRQSTPKLLDIEKAREAMVWRPLKKTQNPSRISGIMRVYCHILKIRHVPKPLDEMFQLPRYWSWFARILNDRRLLVQPIALN